MGTALTIKSNDPCDPDHMLEVFHSDVRDRFIGVDCGTSAPRRSAVNLGNADCPVLPGEGIR
jgi:hypothetical protein